MGCIARSLSVRPVLINSNAHRKMRRTCENPSDRSYAKWKQKATKKNNNNSRLQQRNHRISANNKTINVPRWRNKLRALVERRERSVCVDGFVLFFFLLVLVCTFDYSEWKNETWFCAIYGEADQMRADFLLLFFCGNRDRDGERSIGQT